MKHNNMTGKRVRCIRGWGAIGLQKDATYTVAAELHGLYLSAATIQPKPPGGAVTFTPTGPTTDRAPQLAVPASGMVEFGKPQLIIAELRFPYLLDADRFELVHEGWGAR